MVCARIVSGTESTYTYDHQCERLQGMLLTANGDSIMQTQYKYDPVDNILGISNVITPKAPKKPKGSEGRAVWVALTLYPAPILSITRQRFTKHYFIGDRRIASKIGAGIFQNAYGHGANVVTAGQKDYQMRMMQIEKQREDYYRKLGTPPGVPTMKGATAEPENTHEGYNTIIKELGDHSVPDGWIQRPKRNAVPGTPPGPPVQWDKAEDPDDVQPGYGYVPADTAHHEEIFFYHTDHLGSTSYITDAKANVAQFDAYLPYGELLVDEHSSTEEMPYKFNGKELDEETGLYYYGARYMNPRTSLWYGVDPLAEKYVSTGSYVYCIDNPIRLIDPDGTHWVEDNKKRIVWNEGITNKEQAAAAGLIYRGKSYQRFFINNETYAVKREQYTQDRRLIISKAQKYRMDFSGKVVTAKQLTGRKLNTSRNAPYGIQGKADLNAVFSDGTTRTAATFEFNSGPYGNGPTPNNSYEAFGAVPTNESGMLNNGHTGWKVLLPNYNGRSGLRVHPDTNSPGTKGCIGIVGYYEELKNLGNFFNKYIGPSGKNRMIFNFNIKGNPNYGNEGKANSRLAQ